MQEMPTGWYTRRRAEKQFRPQPAQPYGHMAVQWLTWEAAKNGCTIRHQVNGREKRIRKLPVDGWCPETHTAYQFHGCYFHGCPKCYDHKETNTLNGKTMGTLLENTRRNTAYLRRQSKQSRCGSASGKSYATNRMSRPFSTYHDIESG